MSRITNRSLNNNIIIFAFLPKSQNLCNMTQPVIFGLCPQLRRVTKYPFHRGNVLFATNPTRPTWWEERTSPKWAQARTSVLRAVMVIWSQRGRHSCWWTDTDHTDSFLRMQSVMWTTISQHNLLSWTTNTHS